MKKHLLKFGSKLRRSIAPAAAGVTALVASPFAFAGGGGSAIDTSAITAVFDEYKLAAVTLLIAFVVVLWALRATGLLKPRG